MAITIDTVISELNFINDLIKANPKDKRLKQLGKDAKVDLAVALKKITGEDPLINN